MGRSNAEQKALTLQLYTLLHNYSGQGCAFINKESHYGLSGFGSESLMRSEREIDLKIISSQIYISNSEELGHKNVTEQKAVVRAVSSFKPVRFFY